MTENPNPPSPFIQALRPRLQNVLDDALWTLGGRDHSLWAEHRPTTAAISSQGFKAQLWVALQPSGGVRCTLEIEDEKQGQVPPEIVARRELIADSIRTVAFQRAMMDGLKPSKGSTVARVMLSTNVHHVSESVRQIDIDRVKRFCVSMDEILREWLQLMNDANNGLVDNAKSTGIARPVINHAPRQLDPLLRCQIEKAAVSETTSHFEKNGYRVYSQENDNVGWDLVAMRGEEQLLLEVKGLSGSVLCVELTPNEYAQMQARRDSYRVCIVTSALTKPQLAIFSYSPESGTWQDKEKRTLQVEPVIAARCRLAQIDEHQS